MRSLPVYFLVFWLYFYNLVLSSQHLSRRWRSNNRLSPEPFMNAAEEDNWRIQILELLSKAHTLGGITELSFEIVESRYSVRFVYFYDTCSAYLPDTFRILHLNSSAKHSNGDGKQIFWATNGLPKSYQNTSFSRLSALII